MRDDELLTYNAPMQPLPLPNKITPKGPIAKKLMRPGIRSRRPDNKPERRDAQGNPIQDSPDILDILRNFRMEDR